jgi:ribosome-associated protein
VPDAEVEESFIRASGPGGQNVNKVSTAVQIRFNARESSGLPEWVRRRLEAVAGSRMTKDGVIVITAQRFRTQERNRADALERLGAMVEEASKVKPVRRATRPTFASRQRRLAGKALRSNVKAGRGKPDLDD